MHQPSDPAPGFAPDEPDDGRNEGDWASRYNDPTARKGIRLEAAFLVILFIATPVALFLVWSNRLALLLCIPSGNPTDQFNSVLFLALGGLLGGVLFGMKWLYHVVARNIWNEDRRLWRLLTPLISSGLAFAVGMVIKSDLFGFLDPDALKKPSSSFALGFLIGYFSDSALAKMAEVAQSLFGSAERHKR